MSVFLIIVGYLVGSIPFAFLLTRQFGSSDLRYVGSGNVGATNVLRATNRLTAIIVIGLDVGKSCAVVLLAKSTGVSDAVVASVVTAVVVGHVFPVWLKFRGGKGVATACGGFLVLVPQATVLAVTTFSAMVFLTRYVSLGSIAASIVLAFTVYQTGESYPVVVSAIGIAGLVIYRHRSNIVRMRKGSERTIGQRI
jgi:glycerol-3-phosphate acyltransferase PlsY